MSEVKASVKSGWRKLASYSDDICEMRGELKDLPDSSIWFWVTDKNDQRAKIQKQLRKVREILLSTSSREIMEEIDDIDGDLAELAEKIRDVRERRQLDPDAREDCDKNLEKLNARKAALEQRRAERAGVVCEELRALGLKVGGEAAEKCLFTVNFGDLVDGVIVSRNVACVVDNLRELMVSGEVDYARRYFGMYLVMVDVQIDCFESYLEKSRNGEWRQGINRIRGDAAAAQERAMGHASDSGFTPEQRAAFAHNAKVNGATISAADAYLRTLDAHERIIEEKLVVARRARVLVESSLDTVSLAGDFLNLARSNQDAFDSLMQLELPPVEIFNDAAVQQEFDAITRRLRN